MNSRTWWACTRPVRANCNAAFYRTRCAPRSRPPKFATCCANAGWPASRLPRSPTGTGARSAPKIGEVALDRAGIRSSKSAGAVGVPWNRDHSDPSLAKTFVKCQMFGFVLGCLMCLDLVLRRQAVRLGVKQPCGRARRDLRNTPGPLPPRRIVQAHQPHKFEQALFNLANLLPVLSQITHAGPPRAARGRSAAPPRLFGRRSSSDGCPPGGWPSAAAAPRSPRPPRAAALRACRPPDSAPGRQILNSSSCPLKLVGILGNLDGVALIASRVSQQRPRHALRHIHRQYHFLAHRVAQLSQQLFGALLRDPLDSPSLGQRRVRLAAKTLDQRHRNALLHQPLNRAASVAAARLNRGELSQGLEVRLAPGSGGFDDAVQRGSAER